jgi:hypothetical protein
MRSKLDSFDQIAHWTGGDEEPLIPEQGSEVEALKEMLNWVKTVDADLAEAKLIHDQIDASVNQWSDESKKVLQSDLANYEEKIASTMPSGKGSAATREMLNWVKTVDADLTGMKPLQAQIDASVSKWPDEITNALQSDLANYKEKITSAMPSGKGTAPTQEMLNWVKTVDANLAEAKSIHAQIDASVGKWSDETKYAWQSELNAYKQKLAPKDQELGPLKDYAKWVKSIDADLASGGKLTTQRAQERHKADAEKRVAQEKAAAELAAAAAERVAEQQAEADPANYFVVQGPTGGVHLHKEADEKSPSLDFVKNGEEVVLLKKGAEWFQVHSSEGTGYINNEFLSSNEAKHLNDAIDASTNKWSDETKYAWQDKISAYQKKLDPGGQNLQPLRDYAEWVKTIDTDLAGDGPLTVNQAKKQHIADQKAKEQGAFTAKQAKEKAAAEQQAADVEQQVGGGKGQISTFNIIQNERWMLRSDPRSDPIKPRLEPSNGVETC